MRIFDVFGISLFPSAIKNIPMKNMKVDLKYNRLLFSNNSRTIKDIHKHISTLFMEKTPINKEINSKSQNQNGYQCEHW